MGLYKIDSIIFRLPEIGNNMSKLFNLIGFFLLAWLTMLALEWSQQQHYPQDGIPDKRFSVLSQDTAGQPKVVFWEEIQADTYLLTQATEYGQAGSFFVRLRPLENGSYELYADLGNTLITTRYRIHEGKAEPLYFRVRHISLMFWGLLLAYPLGKLLGKLWFWLRRNTA